MDDFEGSAAVRMPEGRAGQWLVSAGEDGEVLAAEADLQGIRVLLFGKTRKRGGHQLETRLWDLIEAALRDAERDRARRPMPAALHHTLTRLMSWLNEIDGVRSRSRMSAVALCDTGEEVGFGTIGGSEAEVALDDHALDHDWTVLQDRKGREARAFVIEARPTMRLHVEWVSSRSDPSTAGRVLRLDWLGEEAAGFRAPELRMVEPGSSGRPDAAGPLGETDVAAVAPGPDAAAGGRATHETQLPPGAAAAFDASGAEGELRAAHGSHRPYHDAPADDIEEVEEGDGAHAEPAYSRGAAYDAEADDEAEEAYDSEADDDTEAYEPEAAYDSEGSYDAEAYDPEAAYDSDEARHHGAAFEPRGRRESGAWAGDDGEQGYETGPAHDPDPPRRGFASGPMAGARDDGSAPARGRGAADPGPPREVSAAEAGFFKWLDTVVASRSEGDPPAAAAEGSAHAPAVIPIEEVESSGIEVVKPRRRGPASRAGESGQSIPRLDDRPLPGADPAAPRPHAPSPAADPAADGDDLAPPAAPERAAAPRAAAPRGRRRVARPAIGEEAAAETGAPTAAPRPVRPQRPRRPAATEAVPEAETPAERRASSGVPPQRRGARALAAPARDLDAGHDEELAEEEAHEPLPRARAVRRPAWPSGLEIEPRPHPARNWILGAAAVALLFAGGWMFARIPTGDRASGPSPVTRALRAVGIGAPRFECRVTSTPEGAAIAVDGKPLNRRTPATLELPPGEHRVELSLPDLGAAVFVVTGAGGERNALAADLNGTLSVRSDSRRAVRVSVDGVDRGLAPVTIRDLAPGPHEVRFSAPGLQPWGQTLRVGVREEAEIIARPFESPATGLVDIRAAITDEQGVRDLKGAPVWVDGRRRGVTPLTLELPAGPHSVRVGYRDEEAPVQVIDLPGGNQRFATFQFGLGAEAPRLELAAPAAAMPRDRPTTVSAALQGVGANEVREMWLHVRNPEGVWRRYPMALLPASGGVVGVVVFPLALLDARGRAPFYVSAATTVGDEYFTELQNGEPAGVAVETGTAEP